MLFRSIFLGIPIAYYYACISSFSPFDPSYFSIQIPPAPARNFGGLWGASLSAYLVYYCGISMFIIPLPVLFCILNIRFSRIYIRSIITNLLACILTVFSLIVCTEIIFSTWYFKGVLIAPAGFTGEYFDKLSKPYLGWVGQILFLIFISILSLYLWMQERFALGQILKTLRMNPRG